MAPTLAMYFTLRNAVKCTTSMWLLILVCNHEMSLSLWRSYHTDSVLDFWQRSSIPCAHSVSMGGNGDFEK